MRKIIKIGLSVILILLILLYLAYNYVMPGYVADLIINKELPGYIPQKYAEKIKEVKTPVASYNEDVFKTTDSLNLSLEHILRIIDNIDPDEIMNVYYLLEHKNITDSEEVYDVINRTVTIKEIDPAIFKKAFLEFATPGRVNRLLRYAEEHEFATSLGPSAAKKILKQLAIKHYARKEQELKKLINTP